MDIFLNSFGIKKIFFFPLIYRAFFGPWIGFMVRFFFLTTSKLDQRRELNFSKEEMTVQYFIAPFICYIYFGSIPITIRFLTAALPSIAPQIGPRNQALVPLDNDDELGKQVLCFVFLSPPLR